MNQEILEYVKNRIEELYPEILNIRNYFHMNPELSQLEIKTEETIVERLETLNIEYQRGIGGHGVVATIYGRDTNKTTAIRADIDALPIMEKTDTPFKSLHAGIMHACGHDIHTAILLGTAQILKEIKAYLPGSVKLFFQPAEETIGGAKQMIEKGCLENPKVQTVLGLHVNPEIETGKIAFASGVMNAASTEFYVTIKGKSCHGAHPSEGIDTIPIACSMIMSLQTIVSRMVSPTTPSLITVGKINGGTKNNIIAGEISFSGIIRTFSMQERERIKLKLETMCKSIAEASGAICQVTFEDSYPVLINDKVLHDTVKRSLIKAFGTGNVLNSLEASLGADDFSYFCQYSRGLYINIGCHKKGVKDFHPLHSDLFDPDVQCIKTGILAEIVGSISILMESGNDVG